MKSRRRFVVTLSVIGLLALSVGLAVAVCLAVKVWNARDPFAMTRDEDMLRVLGALQSYYRVHHHYPPPVHRDKLGRPLCSWRLKFEPWLHQTDPWEGSGFAWTSSEKLVDRRSAAAMFFCDPQGTRSSPRNETCLVAVVGPGTAFGGDAERSFDVPGEAILILEVKDSGIIWTEPGDLDIRDVPPPFALGNDDDGILIGFADGQLWLLDRAVPTAVLSKFFTVEGARKASRSKELLPYRRNVWPADTTAGRGET